MTPNEYINLAMRTNRGLGYEHDIIHAALLITSEAGEVASEIKRHFAYGKPLDLQAVTLELGDLAWGMALLIKTIGLSFEEVFELNIRKLEARFPELTYKAEHALNRDEDAEKAATC